MMVYHLLFRLWLLVSNKSLSISLCGITDDTGLLKGILKKQNEMLLTAEKLTQLKQHIQVLMNAASVYRMCVLNRNKLISIKG